MNVAELLELSADYIEAEGWWGGNPIEQAPRSTCMVLSLSQSQSSTAMAKDCDLELWDRATEWLYGYLGFEGKCLVEILYDWNDAHTGPEVIETMRKAAQEWRNVHP